MGLVRQKGNMYPWVTHMHAHLAGACPYRCVYCYVQRSPRGIAAKYQGEQRLLPDELGVKYGKGRVIFIEHCADLFATDVSSDWIDKILRHCRAYPKNRYVFQSKNPNRMWAWRCSMPIGSSVGVTIETNRSTVGISQAPQPSMRLAILQGQDWATWGHAMFITVEPILAMDPEHFAQQIALARPAFVNIGADSKRCGLKEPSRKDVLALIAKLGEHKIEIREKHNLARLIGGEG